MQRTTVLVEVRDAQGKPMSGIKAADIELVLGATPPALQSNTHLSALDVDPFPARVCFLQAASGGAVLKGGTATATDQTGRFIMFRVQNEKHTGNGAGEVRIKNLAAKPFSFRSSGQIAVVQMGAGDGFTPQPPKDRNFELDIYPIFRKYACRGCHSPATTTTDGGLAHPGYELSKERGPQKLKADYSGTPDEVYGVLMATNGGDCSAPDKLERVCTGAPEQSLLAHKPFAEPPGQEDHETTLFYSADDPDYRAIVEWIGQGAKR
jgi:hypothetical protein